MEAVQQEHPFFSTTINTIDTEMVLVCDVADMKLIDDFNTEVRIAGCTFRLRPYTGSILTLDCKLLGTKLPTDYVTAMFHKIWHDKRALLLKKEANEPIEVLYPVATGAA